MCGLMQAIKIDSYFELTSEKNEKLKNHYGKPVDFGKRQGESDGIGTEPSFGPFAALEPTGGGRCGLRQGGAVGGGWVAGGGGAAPADPPLPLPARREGAPYPTPPIRHANPPLPR